MSDKKNEFKLSINLYSHFTEEFNEYTQSNPTFI